jgi:DNA-directed RNA polymerase, subunit M/Transcription elongation factor TFIIS
MYKCIYCGSKKILKNERQIRSGDEPMTSFFSCVDCGKGWREN